MSKSTHQDGDASVLAMPRGSNETGCATHSGGSSDPGSAVSLQSAYGLTIASQLPLPGLPLARTAVLPGIRVRFAPPGQRTFSRPGNRDGLCYRSPKLAGGQPPNLEIWRRDGRGYHFTYKDGTEFLVRKEPTEIEAFTPASSSLEDTAYYFNGPILAFVLRQRGIIALHASAVEVGGGAVLFAGPCGAGKSTIAAALARRRYPVITEDLAPIDLFAGRFCCRPGYPRINLWPDSVHAIFGSASALPKISPPWPKCFLDGVHARFVDGGRALAAIYFIAPRVGSVPAAQRARHEISGLRPSHALVKLMANTYMNYLPGADQRARELRVWGAVAEVVPIREVKPVASDLNGLCEAIESDLVSVGVG